MPEKTYIEAITEALKQELEQDQSVFLVGEDVGVRGGVFRATVGLLEQFGPERIIDSPLSESGIVGVAIGAAMHGMKPIAEIQFADFILPAVNQIISEAAKIRYRTCSDFSCPLVIRTPFGGGVHGALYHSQSMEALFTHIPGLKVVIPAVPADAKGLLISAIRDPDPVIFFEHKKCYRKIKGEVPERAYTVPIGKAKIQQEGSDVTIITYGLTLHHCLEAADVLAKEGISCHILDLRTLLPLDETSIVEATIKTGKVLIVHEDNKTHGIGAEVAAIIAEECLFDLDAPIMRLCGPDIPAMPYSPPLENFYLLNCEMIADKIRALASY